MTFEEKLALISAVILSKNRAHRKIEKTIDQILEMVDYNLDDVPDEAFLPIKMSSLAR